MSRRSASCRCSLSRIANWIWSPLSKNSESSRRRIRILLSFLGVCCLRFGVSLGVIIRLPGWVSCAARATPANERGAFASLLVVTVWAGVGDGPPWQAAFQCWRRVVLSCCAKCFPYPEENCSAHFAIACAYARRMLARVSRWSCASAIRASASGAVSSSSSSVASGAKRLSFSGCLLFPASSRVDCC